MKVKEESEKACLKHNIQKTNIIASGPITSCDQTANAGDIRDAGFISGLGSHLDQVTLVFLPGEAHGQRSLAVYSP